MDEVKLNVFLFMAAGFETTSTALAYSTYILATKPDIQKKLQAEIDEHQEKEIDYDLVAKMVYMDLFIQEVLRMFPISAIANNRWCNETTTVCGHQIDKGEYPLIFIYKQKTTCFIRF
jgi:cytochrome P450